MARRHPGAWQCPIIVAIYLSSHALLRGQGLDGVIMAIQRGWLDAVLASYRVWPIIHFLNFALIPESQRVVFTAAVNLFWVAFLSVVGNRATSHGDPQDATA